MATIFNLIPDIENQIINLLHIGELIRLSNCNQAAYQKIINYLPYKSAKQFYNNLDLGKYKFFAVFQKYFLLACRKGQFKIIRYLLEKYDLDNILMAGYEETLRSNNINFVQEFSRQFGNFNFDSLSPNLIWELSPNIIDFVYGLNNLVCNQKSLEMVTSLDNFDLMVYINSRVNIPVDLTDSLINKYLYSLDQIKWLLNNFKYLYSLDQIKWLLNNFKIYSSINFGESYCFIWPYYNSKYNGAIYSDTNSQFLIIFGKINIEDGPINLLENLIPIKNQISQELISACVSFAGWWQKLDLAQYLIKYFLTDRLIILNLFFTRPGPELFQDPIIYGILVSPILSEKLVSRNQMAKSIWTEKQFILAAGYNNHYLLKFILENTKLDFIKIKKMFDYIFIRNNALAKTIDILINLDLINYENIKNHFIKNIYQDFIYQTDMLALVIREIKKADHKFEFDINKLFGLACTVSKNQAKLVYDNYHPLIYLDKNQMVWLDKN